MILVEPNLNVILPINRLNFYEQSAIPTERLYALASNVLF